MGKIILMYGGKYRITQLNSCLRYFRTEGIILFSTKSYLLFKFIFFFFKKKVIPVFLDGKFITGNYSKSYILWFNTSNEIPELKKRNKNNLFLCLDPKKDNNLFPLTTKINSGFILKLNKNTKIVYISEVDINVNNDVKNFWNKNKNEIFNNLDLVNDISFIKKIFFTDEKENYINYFQLKNLLRFELINFVNKYFSKNLFLVGKDWAKLGFGAQNIQYDTSFRKKSYMNSICLDFGSKSGLNSLYPRTIEILENKGFLLQSKQYDSKLFKKNLPNNYDFLSLLR
ncbi:MAG: hypothetical protein CMC22_06940 [Flavobacteriaceae bacterium]|nr:hypothetical protein [Flavobacteriaceae bacterium]